jgi:hypothetical protein
MPYPKEDIPQFLNRLNSSIISANNILLESEGINAGAYIHDINRFKSVISFNINNIKKYYTDPLPDIWEDVNGKLLLSCLLSLETSTRNLAGLIYIWQKMVTNI